MTTKTKVARRCGNNNRAMSQNRLLFDRSSSSVTQEYGKGALAAGLLTAITVGAQMIMEAVL